MYKFSVYGMRSLDDFYYYDPKSFLLFTCNDKDDKLVVITITKRGRATFPSAIIVFNSAEKISTPK
jgi:hypothetical protein